MANPIFHSAYTAAQIEALIAHGVPIIKNGTWWTWDIADGEYKDTGKTVDGTTDPYKAFPHDTVTNAAVASITDGADGIPVRDLQVAITAVQSGSGDPSPTNVRPISGWSSVNVVVSPTLDAQDGTTYPISLGQTVYGGTLDVTTGVLTITHARINLGSLTWTTTSLPLSVSTATQSLVKIPASTATVADIICDSYAASSRDAISDKHICIANNGSTIISDTRFNGKTAAQIKALLDGVYMVYAMKTPTTVQLTPTEVKTLLGTNNIFADSGNIILLDYRADTTLYIARKLAV